VKTKTLSPELLHKIDAYWRAANYLSTGQIYLYDNPLLKRPLTLADVKHMLLGHWGTTPGQNFIYVHLNRVIKEYDLDMIYVSGPGHGGPAVVSNTYLEAHTARSIPISARTKPACGSNRSTNTARTCRKSGAGTIPNEYAAFRGGRIVKKLIVFDLDGTLAESKSSLDAEMSVLLYDLLGSVKVAVISGGGWPQFEKQLLSNLPHDERLVNLSLLPTCGTKFFQYKGDWERIYSEDFNTNEKEKIVGSLEKAVGMAGFKVEKVWGEAIEDRGSQITFSALGQQAPWRKRKNGTPISPSGRRSR